MISEELKKMSAKVINNSATALSETIEATMKGLMGIIPQDASEQVQSQMQVDTVRGMHQSLAYQLGALEEQLIRALESAGLPNARELVLADHNKLIEKGREAARDLERIGTPDAQA